MKRDELIAALAATGEDDVTVWVTFDGTELDVTEVVKYRSADGISLTAVDETGRYQAAHRYLPQDDDESLGHVVSVLRHEWGEHRETHAGQTIGPTPDFYGTAVALLTRLYECAYLRVPLPADIDPNGICGCTRTPEAHKPRQHPACGYRREVQ